MGWRRGGFDGEFFPVVQDPVAGVLDDDGDKFPGVPGPSSIGCRLTMIRPLAWTRRRTAMDPAGSGGRGAAASRAPANLVDRSAVMEQAQVPARAPSAMACMRYPPSRLVTVLPTRPMLTWYLQPSIRACPSPWTLRSPSTACPAGSTRVLCGVAAPLSAVAAGWAGAAYGQEVQIRGARRSISCPTAASPEQLRVDELTGMQLGGII
jgi:hypothetical protein